MKLLYHLSILIASGSLALSCPMPSSRRADDDKTTTRGTESGAGTGPSVDQGPKPEIISQPPDTQRGGRPNVSSSVPFGTIISSCTQPGTVALTFDDGPYIYTSAILDVLRSKGVPATFFVNGANWDNILSDRSQALVRRMVAEGHQIGSHTYVAVFRASRLSHLALSSFFLSLSP